MNFSLPYFTYCENAVGILSQPFNVFTGLAYIAVAFFLWIGGEGRDRELRTVAAFLVFIHGVCSVFWHITDMPLGLTFDIISAILLAAFLETVLLHRLLRWPSWLCMLAVVTTFVFAIILKDTGVPYLSQNGGAFLPFLFVLAFVALAVQRRNQNATIYLLSSSYALLFAIAFRSVDWMLCTRFETGTHFLSHIMGAVAILYAVIAIDADYKNMPDKKAGKKQETKTPDYEGNF